MRPKVFYSIAKKIEQSSQKMLKYAFMVIGVFCICVIINLSFFIT